MTKLNRDILPICENFCPVLWNEMTIDQHGYIIFCCHSTKGQHAHISEIDNLLDFFNGKIYQKARKLLWEEDKIHPACQSCIDRNKNNISTLRTYKLQEKFNLDVSNYNKQKINMLEINFSNICNQQCVMCNSTYSSKWFKDDTKLKSTEFNRTPVKMSYKLSDDDILKIIEIIDSVEILNIKGGEPTIDPSFIKFMEMISKKYPQKQIRLVTNFQSIDPQLMDSLCKLTDLSLVVSLDGTHELYNWIRGGDYDKVISNLKHFAEFSVRPRINFTTAFTCFNIHTLNEFIQDIEKLNQSLKINYSGRLSLRLVNYPSYASPFNIDIDDRQEIYKNLIKLLQSNENIVQYKSIKVYNVNDMKPLNDLIIGQVGQHTQWEKEIDKIRGYKRVKA